MAADGKVLPARIRHKVRMADESPYKEATRSIHYVLSATEKDEAYRFRFNKTVDADPIFSTVTQRWYPPKLPRQPRLSLVQREANKRVLSSVMADLTWQCGLNEAMDPQDRFLEQVATPRVFCRGSKYFQVRLTGEAAGYHEVVRCNDMAASLQSHSLSGGVKDLNNRMQRLLCLLGEIIRQMSVFHPHVAKALLIVRDNMVSEIRRAQILFCSMGAAAIRQVAVIESHRRTLQAKIDDISTLVADMQSKLNDVQRRLDNAMAKVPKPKTKLDEQTARLQAFVDDVTEIYIATQTNIPTKLKGKAKLELERKVELAKRSQKPPAPPAIKKPPISPRKD